MWSQEQNILRTASFSTVVPVIPLLPLECSIICPFVSIIGNSRLYLEGYRHPIFLSLMPWKIIQTPSCISSNCGLKPPKGQILEMSLVLKHNSPSTLIDRHFPKMSRFGFTNRIKRMREIKPLKQDSCSRIYPNACLDLQKPCGRHLSCTPALHSQDVHVCFCGNLQNKELR